MRAANINYPPQRQRSRAIGNDTVFGPITAADHIAGPNRTQRNIAGRRALREKRRSIRRDDDLRAGLARAVGIMSAKAVFLFIGVIRLSILIALVRRDNLADAHGLRFTDGF